MNGPNKPASSTDSTAGETASPTPNPAPISGLLVIDKPAGMSSMSAVVAVRRRARGTKTGHAGTLDPLATGVLVLALGRATRTLGEMMATDKRYLTDIDLSCFTTTDDLEGDRQEVEISHQPGRKEVIETVRRFTGRIMQRPPQFSAVKIDGRRAYKRARQGEVMNIEPRPVLVHSIYVESYEWPIVRLSIHCDKGFYVRSLARELGEALGTGGHCRLIRRTAVGPFIDAMALALDEVPDPLEQDHLIPGDDAQAMVREHREALAVQS